MAPGQGQQIATIVPLFAFLQDSLVKGAILLVLNPFPQIANSEATLSWRDWLTPLWDLSPPNPQIAHSGSVARQAAPPCMFPELGIHRQAAALSLSLPWVAHTLWVILLVVGHSCQPKLQCLSSTNHWGLLAYGRWQMASS